MKVKSGEPLAQASLSTSINIRGAQDFGLILRPSAAVRNLLL